MKPFKLKATRAKELLHSPANSLNLGRRILQEGNDKLSRSILTFGLPADLTCPGASKLCLGACYACKGHYLGEAAQRRRAENHVLARRRDFHRLVIDELRCRPQKVLRPHDSGDFFSAAYAEQWIKIATAGQKLGIQVFGYSRSWRQADIRDALVRLGNLPNVRLWWSCDRETGVPKAPSRIRLAYMQVAPDDMPHRRADLVFRDYPVRKDVAKRIDGSLVCPYENGATGKGRRAIDCFQCGLCWDQTNPNRDPRRHRHSAPQPSARRRSLELV